MVLPRPTTLRGFAPARLLRSSVRPQLKSVARRGYASGGSHGSHEPSSDLPWLLSGVAVTVPSCYFLWPEASHETAHGHDDAHGEGEGHEESEDAPAAEDEEEQPSGDEGKEDAAPAEQPEDGDKEQESKDDKPEGEDDKQSEGGDDKKPEGGDDNESKGASQGTKGNKTEGVQFKGKTSAGDDDNEMPDTRKREPDSKGAFKKRIDSGYQKDLGAGAAKDEDGNKTAASATPPSGDAGAIDTKQKGLSTTPTRHSTQIDQDPEKSKKGEGTPETAKSMGTVDPSRPQK